MGSRLVRFHLTALAIALATSGCAPSIMMAQEQQTPEVFRSELLEPFTWRNLGPDRGGRSIAVAGSDARPFEYYFGATGGGLWKTTDGGTTWRPVTDGQMESSSVGAVDVCNAAPDIVWFGTGESDIRGNIMNGDGVYRSTDGGKKWEHVGLGAARNIAKVRIDPADCGTVWVAAMGHYGEPNAERGVYRTTDGGETWEKVLFVDSQTGAVDLSLDPNNGDRAFASAWEFWRKPWGMSSGGPGSSLYRTTDGGATWDDLKEAPGLPGSPWGKIGVAISPVDGQRVWAIIEAPEGGVFRSDDGGDTWAKVNDERKLRQRAFYYTRIYADPQEKDVVYVLNTAFYKSEDGGETFDTRINVPHGDNHDLWIAPSDNQRMINGNDGGGNVSVNGGRTWTDQDFPTAQFYHVITTSDIPYHVCGAQQDNSTVCMPSDGGAFYPVAGGESGYIAPDPRHPNITYGGSYGGYLQRYDRETGISAMVNVWPDNPMGFSSEDIAERFQWTYPIVFDPHDPNVLYATSQHVWKTTNGGMSWERISPDLTAAADSTMGPSGGPITLDQTGVETYATIFALAPSPVEEGVIWAGSDDGLVHITRDGGGSWTDVTPPAMPEQTRVSMIDASPHDACRAYVAGNRYLLGDLAPYMFRTDDCGETWTDISGGIPAGDFPRAIREDPVRAGMLYAATERGVWVSWDDGARWQSLSRNLPVAQVSDLVVKDADLVISTHGRGFWIMDDIGPLRQLDESMADDDVHLFEPADPVLGVHGSLRVAYLLGEDVDAATVEILDADGNVIQSYEGTASDEEEGDEEESGGGGWWGGGSPEVAVSAGLHSLTWNLRYPGAASFPNLIMWAASTRFGPAAPPGEYTVRFTADGFTQEQSFEIEPDPRRPDVTVADLQEQFRFSMEVQGKVTEANNAVRLIRGIEEQIDARVEARPEDAELAGAAETLEASLNAVEGEIYQVRNRSNQDPLNFPIKLNNRIAALLGVVQGAPGRPTAQSYEVFEMLSGLLGEQLSALQQILDQDLPRFNQMLASRDLDPVERRMIPEEAPDGGDEGVAEPGEGGFEYW